MKRNLDFFSIGKEEKVEFVAKPLKNELI